MKTPSMFARSVARALLAVISFQLAIGTQIAGAQTAPVAPAPADTRTTVTSSANGTPVLNIATPNGAGVSHNRFNTYAVDSHGLILNNSAVNAVSIIGGGTAANGNLANGQAASLILNEVVSANAGSTLAGYQEILGPSAELVIANPWGVTCNGCGFLNTPRVTLTTGVPTLSASGALAGFTITGGQIAIGKNGLDATRPSTLDLLARSVSFGGNVIVGSQANGVAGDLQVVAGSNSFNYATRTATGIAGGSATPQFAIDSSMLGGMYADRIRLLVNEHGAGVLLAGNVAALADDLVISADGRIELRGAASAGRDLTVHGGDVQVQLADSNTYLYGGRDLSISAAGGLQFDTGSIGAGRNTSFVSTGSFKDLGGANDLRFSGSNGVVTANAGGSLTLSGGYWSGPQLTFDAQSIHLGAGSVVYGTGATGNAVSFATPGLFSIAGGKVYSNADATLDASRLEVDSAGVVAATGGLSATVSRGSAGGIDNAGTLQGNAVNVVAAGDPTSTPTTFHNASSGTIVANKALTIGESGGSSAAGSTLQNDGTLVGDAVTIGTSTTANTKTIQATTNLDLRSATLQNTGSGASITGSTSATGSASIAAATITNSGTIWSAGDLALAPTTLTQQRAPGATTNPLIGAGRDLTIAFTGNADLGSGDLQAGRDLTITGAQISDRGLTTASGADRDLRYAGRNLVATAAPGGSVDIAGGLWYSQGDLRLTGDGVILGSYPNQLGSSTGVVGVQVDGAQSGTGVVALTARTGNVALSADSVVHSGCSSSPCQNPSGGDLSITQSTPFVLLSPNTLQANGALSIGAGGTIDNFGTIWGGTVSLASNNGVPLQFRNGSTGAVTGTQLVQIGTSAMPADLVGTAAPANPNDGVFGGLLDINTATLLNNGTLQAVGAGSTINAGLVSNGGSIKGFADSLGRDLLTINATSISNYGTLFDAGALTINSANLINEASGSIGSPGLLTITTGGTGALPLLNDGLIGGGTLDLLAFNGITNGRDPGDPANRAIHADIFASSSLGIRLTNGSNLTNYGTIESDKDASISYVGAGSGSLLNQMSLVPDSELKWVEDPQKPTPAFGGVSLLQRGQNGATDKHDFTIDTTGTHYYFGDTFQTQAYQDARLTYVQNQTFDNVTPAVNRPTIRAGHNLAIVGFDSVLNNGQIEAVNNATITGASPASTISNTSLYFGQRDRYVDYVEAFTCQATVPIAGVVDWGCGQPVSPTILRDDGAYGGFTPITSYSNKRTGGNVAYAGSIIAGGTLTIQGTVKNSGTVNPFTAPPQISKNKDGAVSVSTAGAPGSLQSATTLNVNGASIPLPSSGNGRFVLGQGSTTGPLVETNPLFSIDSLTLGSDYLAKLLKLDPDKEDRRLGDNNYEAYLIQQQVLALTGQSVLSGYGYVGDMEKALFDNAQTEATALNLSYGKALTSEQIASLKSDIIWLVEEEVQGQKVLVPVVYLTDATRAQSLNTGNATLAGYNVDINGGAVTNTGGDIVARNSLNIKTTGNIENLSGNISGWNVRLNAGGDIVNSTLVTRVGDQNNGTDVAQRVATISAGNTAVLRAAKDITVNGGSVTAAKDAALIAGNNVNIQSFALTTNVTGKDGSWSHQSQTAQSAGVNAGGKVIVNAGQNVNVTGADIAAGDTAFLHAEHGNANVNVLELKETYNSSESHTGNYTQLDTDKGNASATLGAGVEHTTTTNSRTITTGVGSDVSGKGVVLSTGQGDVNVTGSSVNAGSDGIVVDSARNVNITAYNNKDEDTYSTSRVRAGVQLDASADGAFGGLAESGNKTTTTTTQTTAQVSALKSAGNIVIKGKGDVTNEGTQFDAAGHVMLSGENVINKAAQDTFKTSTTESKWETKQQEGLTTNGTGQSINNAAQGKGNQVTVGNLEWQQRVTGSYSTDTNTYEESKAHGTEIKAGGNIVVNAKNNASDQGTQYTAGKNVVLSAENYENKAAADTTSTTDETTYGSGKVTAGLNSAAEVAITASADGGHQKSGTGTSTAKVGSINAGGVVVVNARSGDVTLEGTQVSGDKGVGITAARDVNINQANDTTTTTSSEQSGSGRVSASVSLLGTGASVGVGASTRLANENDSASTARTASIKSGGGNVQLTAGRDLTSQGANVEAAENVDLKAARDIKLAAATDKTDNSGSVDAGGADVNVGFGTGAAKGSGSGGVNVNFERGRTDYHETTEHGSTIKAGGNLSVDAGRNAVLQGTQVDANTASLKTGGNLVLESAQHTVKDNSYDVSGDLSASVSKGGGAGGASTVAHGGTGSSGAKGGGNAGGGNAQVNVVQSKQDIETNTNATINTRGGTTVDVGGDLSLKGANINAQGGVSGNVAGNLTIETRTDKENVDQTNVRAYAGVGPVGGSGGGSKSQRIQEGVQTGANHIGQDGVFADVNAQKKDNVTVGTASGISGGNGGISVHVGGDTTLKGATNSGTDFQTAGKTTIDAVDTHTSESSTKFRAPLTVASAAGSDNGKGGDFGLSVHTPGAHGPAEEGPNHSSAGPKQTEAPTPPRRGAGADAPEAPPATRPRADTIYANDPNAQPTRPRADTVYANVDPTAPVTRPRAASEPPAVTRPRGTTEPTIAPDSQTTHPVPDHYANIPDGAAPNAPVSRPRADSIYANVDPTAPVTRPRAASEPPVATRPRDDAGPFNPAANNDGRRAYGVPIDAEHAEQHAGDQHLAMVAPHNGAAPAEGSSGAVQHALGHQPALGPASEIPAEQQRHDLIVNNERARDLLRLASGRLNDAEQKDFEVNLSETVAFANETRNQEKGDELLRNLKTSVEGPTVRPEDGLTLFPLRPQYVGENVDGFEHWKIRHPDEAPGQKYQDDFATRKVRYYTPEEQEKVRVFVGADKQLHFADGSLTSGKWMFVVDSEGRLLARPYPIAQAFRDNPDLEFIHHSSLAAGKPVLMAGHFQIDPVLQPDHTYVSKITDIENESGHFRPDTQAFERFLVALREGGVDLTSARAPSYSYEATAHNQFQKVTTNSNLLRGATLDHVDSHDMVKLTNAPAQAGGQAHFHVDPVDGLRSADEPGDGLYNADGQADEGAAANHNRADSQHAAGAEPPPVQPPHPEDNGVAAEPLHMANYAPARDLPAAPVAEAPAGWVAGRPSEQPGSQQANGRGNVALAQTRRESPEIRLARIQDSVRNILRSDEEVQALAIHVDGLRGSRVNPDDIDAAKRNLAEIVEFTKGDSEERKRLLSRFETSLQPPHEQAGVKQFPLLPQYIGEELPGFVNWRTQGASLPGESYGPGREPAGRKVTYLTEPERENARLYVHDGRFYNSKGEQVRGTYIFVVDLQGRLIAVPTAGEVSRGNIHHSSLSDGQPVRMAGQITISEDGRLDEVINRSGHFRPDQQSLERFLGELLAKGVKKAPRAIATVQEIEGRANGGINPRNVVNNLFTSGRPLTPGRTPILASLKLPDGVRPQVRPSPAAEDPVVIFREQPSAAPRANVPDGYSTEETGSQQRPANAPQAPPQPNGGGNPPMTWRMPLPARGAGDVWRRPTDGEWRVAA